MTSMRIACLSAAAVVLAASVGCGSGASDGFRAKLSGEREVEYAGSATFCRTGRGTLYTLDDARQEGQITLARFSHELPPVGTFPVVVLDRARSDPGVWFVPTLTFLGPRLVGLADADSGTVTISRAEPGAVRGSFWLRVVHGGGTVTGTSVLTGTFSARGGGECEEPGQPTG